MLAGAAVIGVSSVLAACGSDTGTGTDTGSGAGSVGNAAAGTSTATVPTDEVPVGGGKIVVDEQLVVTQPSEGVFRAFSAVCTHQGCVVAKIDNARITCTCHNSIFSITDGAVVSGPAPRALDARQVTRSGDTLTIR